MAVFLVHMPEGESDDVSEKVAAAYPGKASHEIKPHWFLVRDDNTTSAVGKRVGIGDDDDTRTLGFVLKLNSQYSGMYARSLWEWLELELAENGGS